MDVRWVKIRSWHAVKSVDDPLGWAARTYCGRFAQNQNVVDDLPAEPSCETCLRIIARQRDA